MAQRRLDLLQLQQILGLAPSGKPVRDVVFVCIDCEAFESDQNKITEIGISLLDSRSIKDVDPRENGEPWFNFMKHMHLRPIEFKKLINKRFVKGCPEKFNFGESTFVKLKDVGRIMDRIFDDPSRINDACNFDVEITNTEPAIILVGHDLKNDTDYLNKLNFSPKHVAGKLDTQTLARISKAIPPGLTKLLAALSIDAKNLHNAGNDAAYTLQALVGLAVQEHQRPGDVVRALVAEKIKSDALKEQQKMAMKAKADAKAAVLKARADAKAAKANRRTLTSGAPIATETTALPMAVNAETKTPATAALVPDGGNQTPAKTSAVPATVRVETKAIAQPQHAQSQDTQGTETSAPPAAIRYANPRSVAPRRQHKSKVRHSRHSEEH